MRSFGSSGSARRTWAFPSGLSSTTPASCAAGGRGGTAPVARDPFVSAIRCWGGPSSRRTSRSSMAGWRVSRSVSTAAVRPVLRQAGRRAPGVGATAGGGQHAACPPTARGPRRPAKHRRGLRPRKLPAASGGADGAAATGGGHRDLHPAREHGRDSERAQRVLPGGEEASRTVSPAGDGYRSWVADSLPGRASAEGLALQATEQTN